MCQGPRCYSKCASLVTSDGKDLVWVVTVRYLGVFITLFRGSLSGESQSLRFNWISFHKNFNENFQNETQKIVTECQNYFSLHTVGELMKKRKLQFLQYCYVAVCTRRREALRRPQREERVWCILWRPPARLYCLLKSRMSCNGVVR